ncbi:hypothetical protein [Terasakiella pusilla]|uniref:hypothetical protein n=1 Tax=Terasakiella pusilla TaxID=64973 RepID=UPI003AA81E7E
MKPKSVKKHYPSNPPEPTPDNRGLLPEGLPLTLRETKSFWVGLLSRAEKRDEDEGTGDKYLRNARRWLCRNDLFFLMFWGLGRKDMLHPWLFRRCREVQAFPNGYLDLWSREHYKSTIITFGQSIQDILASHGDNPAPRFNGREVTIGIFSHTRGISKAFLKQIKDELEENVRLKDLFPDILWSRPPRKGWSLDSGIIVKRKSNPKEATVEAWGLVDGQPTGRHFWTLLYDDVVTVESVNTPEQIKKTTAAWELSDNLGTEGGNKRYAGTRYHLFDTYTDIIKRGAAITRVHLCTKDGTENFVKENCTLKHPNTLAEKRKTQGPYTFGAQMLQDPTADTSMGFDEEWLRYWTPETYSGLNIAIIVDPSSGKEKNKSKNDYTAIWVLGFGGDRKVRQLRHIRDRLNLTARTKALIDLHREWSEHGNIFCVGYEQYGMQADIEHIETQMKAENYEFEITELGGSMTKVNRILRLVPWFEQGRVLLLERDIYNRHADGNAVNTTKLFIEEEYTAFPVCNHDDSLDGLARIFDIDIEWPARKTVGHSQHDSMDHRTSW